MQKAPFSDERYRNPPAAPRLWTLPPRSLLSAAAHWKTAGKFIFQHGRALASNLLLERIKELKKSIRCLSEHAHSSISRKVVLEELQEDMLANQARGLWKAEGHGRGVRMKINYMDPEKPMRTAWSTSIFLFFMGSQTALCFMLLMDGFTVQIGVDTQRLNTRLLAKPAD